MAHIIMTDVTGRNFFVQQQADGTDILVINKEFHGDLHSTLQDMTEDPQFYDDVVRVSAMYFKDHLHHINRRVIEGNDALLHLQLYLTTIFESEFKRLSAMTEKGRVGFDALETVFRPGTKIVTMVQPGDQLVGSIVSDTRVQQTMSGPVFVITGPVTRTDGNRLYLESKRFVIEGFGNVKDINSLPVRPLNEDDEEYAYLVERGLRFSMYYSGAQYLQYDGDMFNQTPYGTRYFKASGRVVIDHIGYAKQNPGARKHANTTRAGWGDTGMEQMEFHNNEIPPDGLFRTWPFFDAYSIVTKEWGQLFVDKLSDPQFDDNAFSLLHMDETTKEWVKAVTTNYDEGFTDIISGKSGGIVMLLYGPPGTGKTLTCEATAELLHRPLYTISSGKLGDNPEKIEKKLEEIFEMTLSWNAVVLIDEADVFLCRRKENLQQTMIVSTYLSLLDKFKGVMFLTTNRHDIIDPAIASRVSLSIRYDNFDLDARVAVWHSLLHAADLHYSDETINELAAEYQVNGREIKNSIRLAQSFAKGQKRGAEPQDIIQVLGFRPPALKPLVDPDTAKP
jgi:hypothetical protein